MQDTPSQTSQSLPKHEQQQMVLTDLNPSRQTEQVPKKNTWTEINI